MRVIDYLNRYLTEDEQRRFKVNVHLEIAAGILTYNEMSYDEYVMCEVSGLTFIGYSFTFNTTEEGGVYWCNIKSRDVPLSGSFIIKHIKKHKMI